MKYVTSAFIAGVGADAQVDVSAVVDQEADYVQIALGDGYVDWALAVGRYQVWVAVFLQKSLCQRVVALKTSR